MHADGVRLDGLDLDGVRVHVLEHLDMAIAVGCLEHGDVGGVTVQADGGVSPLAADPGASEHRQAEVGEEGDRGVQVADGDTDVLEFDGDGSQASARDV